jgi:DNA modification methylase
MNYAELKINPANPRKINEKQFEKLKKSIKEFDEMLMVREIVYDSDGVIWGGNQRYRALQMLINEGLMGYKDKYFRELPKNWTLKQKQEFAVKDNNPEGISGAFDDDVLANEWSDLPLEEWGIDVSGWEKEVEEDEAPEVDELGEPVSKLGEVYQLGRHRLMCGDSTKIEDVEKLMNGQKADMVFTDPPYGVSYEGGMKHWDMIKNDDDLSFLPEAIANLYLFQKSGGATYICFNDRAIPILESAYKPYYEINKLIVWVKNNSSFQIGAHYKQKHEVILYLKRLKDTLSWYGGDTEVTTWEISRASANEFHPTEKPVSLCARAIKNSSKQDGCVLDLFGGSGSTLIACEQLNRTCLMSEIDPRYCDVIRKRYAKFMGKEDEWEQITPKI